MAGRYEGPVVCLMGATATGKTDTAVLIAEQLPVRIISVDSALVYRGMDIGTAKPDAELRRRHPHHLVDIRDPHEPYSAAEFCEDARREIEQARREGRIPLLVGGTMLYFRALRDGLASMPGADPDVRADIEALASERGWPAVHARLRQVDPAAAARLRPTDSQRLQRALEVYEVTGVPLTEWHARQAGAGLGASLLQFGLVPAERSWLHERIGRRLEAMLEAGFVDEMRRLHALPGLHAGLPALRCVGYRQFWQWLEGQITFERACEAARAATRQLAKRQLTWLRGWPGLTEIAVGPALGPDAAARWVTGALAGAGSDRKSKH